MQIVSFPLWNICLHIFLYIYIFDWCFRQHCNTNQGHTNKHSYDSLVFFLVNTNRIDISPYIWLLYIMVDCLSFSLKWLSSLLFIYIHVPLIFYASHPYTSRFHKLKGYDSRAFLLVMTNKIDNSPYIWLLYIIVDCLSFFMECLSSLLLIYIHLQLLVYASLPYTSRPY